MPTLPTMVVFATSVMAGMPATASASASASAATTTTHSLYSTGGTTTSGICRLGFSATRSRATSVDRPVALPTSSSAFDGSVGGTISWGRPDKVVVPTEKPEWLGFLKRLADHETGLSKDQVDQVKQIWRQIRAGAGYQLGLPRVDRGDNESMLLSWSSEIAYAEIDIQVDGSHSWFVDHYKADEFFGSRGGVMGAVAEVFIAFLRSSFHVPG